MERELGAHFARKKTNNSPTNYQQACDLIIKIERELFIKNFHVHIQSSFAINGQTDIRLDQTSDDSYIVNFT